jgi:hypothetical protein
MTDEEHVVAGYSPYPRLDPVEALIHAMVNDRDRSFGYSVDPLEITARGFRHANQVISTGEVPVLEGELVESPPRFRENFRGR